MRRFTGIVLGALLVIGAIVAPAAASKARARATYDFDLTKPGASAWYGGDYGVFFGDAVAFNTAPRQRAAMVHVADDSGKPVSAAVWQEGKRAYVFCESLPHFPVSGGDPIFVQVIVDVTPTTGNGCATPALPTTGTVEVMFR